MKSLTEQYNDLEASVINKLKALVLQSTVISKHTAKPCIRISLFDYDEISIVNGDLVFLSKGYQYNSMLEVELSDLVDLATKLEQNTKEPLPVEDIARRLLRDMPAYGEFVEELLKGALLKNTSARVYWDAWFRGSNGKDLEKAQIGIIYKK